MLKSIIPAFDKFIDPILTELNDNQIHHIYDVTEEVLTDMNLPSHYLGYIYTTNNRSEGIIHNRMRWAYHYLKKAGLVKSKGRGKVKITPQGQILAGIRKDKSEIYYKNKSSLVNRKLLSTYVPELHS